jgi:hypothetical protein
VNRLIENFGKTHAVNRALRCWNLFDELRAVASGECGAGFSLVRGKGNPVQSICPLPQSYS